MDTDTNIQDIRGYGSDSMPTYIRTAEAQERMGRKREDRSCMILRIPEGAGGWD